jgi:hypothetical protein
MSSTPAWKKRPKPTASCCAAAADDDDDDDDDYRLQANTLKYF